MLEIYTCSFDTCRKHYQIHSIHQLFAKNTKPIKVLHFLPFKKVRNSNFFLAY